MTKNLILLGAGASVTSGVPVISTFLDQSYRIYASRAQDISRESFERIFDLIQNKLPLLYAKAAVNLDNLESVFGLLETADILGRLPGTQADQIAGLLKDMRIVIAETVQRCCRHLGDPYDGWSPGKDYDSLAKVVVSQASKGAKSSWAFITFNYDIALDFALLHNGIELDYTIAKMNPWTHSATAPLLKLHGSLNWGIREDGGSIDWVNLRNFIDRQRPRIRGNHHWPILAALKEDHPHANLSVAIAPPSWNKFHHYRSFLPVWQRAATELSIAENIYVIGYSAPKTDGFFHDLLSLGLQGSTRLRRFCVVNPDLEALTRIQEMLGPQIRSRFEPFEMTFSQFLPDFARLVEESEKY